MARMAWITTGIFWAVASLLLVGGAAYYEPVTLLDWAAVLTYTAALVWLGLSIACIGRLVPSRPVRITALIAAVPPIVTGVANLVEDGFDVAAASSVYVAGSLLTVVGLVALAAALLWARATRLAALCLLVTLGLLFVVDGGGVVILLLLEYLAGRTAWFQAPPTQPAGPSEQANAYG